jgi:hypothetical protein
MVTTVTTKSHWLARLRSCGTTHFLVTAALRYVSSVPMLAHEQQLTFAKADSVFSGISTFGRLPYSPCLNTHAKYDIAFIGENT